MIALNNISLRFGSFELFSDIGFMINERDRIGLVGRNGAGKTTLLKIITGEITPSSGNISIPNDVSIGYLPQHLRIKEKNISVYEEAKTAFSEILQLEKKIKSLNEEISQRTDYESEDYIKLLSRLAHTSDRFNIFNSDNVEADIAKTLKGLGFKDEDLNRQLSEFSGGWRMRIELAKLLLKTPEVLLLDEPTNHLDIVAIQWLEEFLKEYKGAVVLISHDRTFLDNITNRTIEISLGTIYDYKLPYSKFITAREERLVQQKAAWENQQKLIADTERFIERFRYKATKANQVQSRIKQLEKIEPVAFDEIDTRSIHFRFQPAPRSGTIILEANNLSKAYDKNQVLKDIDFIAERGDKIALVGKNGEGKSTFSKIIAGVLDYEGDLKIGHNVKIGYYAQNQEELLDEELSVFETLDRVAVGDIRQRLREILGSFLFSGEDIDKKVKVLSGGEKSRLALAKLILEPCNLLILDEPTNHLDIRSKDILREALINYDGSLIIV
ncbi:MAG: ABC-F family ATP-binding cassette domain-containing protein, partial [Bacteroidales bacterium]|nr:ABC-F family ATP-binding cassette domain-containing protein [Bacteroidales bacterium]